MVHDPKAILPAACEVAQDVLNRFAVDDLHVEGRLVTAPVSGGAQTLTEALRALDSAGVKLADVGLRKPTLDDVFLSLTGHTASEEFDTGDLKEVA